MAKRRKVSNVLALALLATLSERPMHPYEMASVLRARGKEHNMKINWGSLYTVVQNLEKHGFIEAAETTRQGKRPERTVYGITDAGREELEDWVRELIGTPEREYPKFEAALSVLPVLSPEECIKLLDRRLHTLQEEITTTKASLRNVSKDVPRLFLIEEEYHVALLSAEAKWVAALLKEFSKGSFPGLDLWRQFHEHGEMSPELAELARRGSEGN